MASLSNTNTSNMTMDGETQNVPFDINKIITIIINGLTCPFTVMLNVLVIMAVKRRPRLQSYANILLSCLAGTDALTGLLVQPSFILFKTAQLLGRRFHFFHYFFILAVSVCSALHLVLVTCERLIAIKFTLRYPYLVTTRKNKQAVIACWVVALICALLRLGRGISYKIGDMIAAVVLVSCIVVIVVNYVIFYLETLRHQKQIQTQQLPQEEVERFAKESKALKTTVYVVGAAVICYLPMVVVFVTYAAGGKKISFLETWIRTCAMLNSLLNPLIYCWRQKEMRKFVFRIKSAAVEDIN